MIRILLTPVIDDTSRTGRTEVSCIQIGRPNTGDDTLAQVAILCAMPPADDTPEIVVERYKYILQQIHTVNENVYRFLGIFQALVTALVTAALVLFISYSKWNINASTARTAETGLLVLITVIAGFTVLLLVVGVLSWVDYRHEECEVTEKYVAAGFRKKPRLRNFYRWYETYIILFVVAVTVLLWILAESFLIPRIK